MKNHKRGFLGIAILVVIALALIGGGVYVTSHNKTEVATTTEGDNVPTPTSIATVTPTPSPTATVKANISFSVSGINSSGNDLSVVNNGKVTQTISLSAEAIAAIQFLPAIMDSFIRNQDVNFDGYSDVGVLTGVGYGGVNVFYDYYIFNPSTNLLVKDPVLLQVSNPVVDKVNKKVNSSFRSGPQWYSQSFQWNGSGFIKSDAVKS